MNLALPALVILLGILPGIACFYGYFAGRFDKRAAGLSGVSELALYVLFAIPIDALALMVCRRLGVGLEFPVVTRLLAAALPETSISDVATALQRSAETASATYVSILVCSYALGSIARRTVWTSRLDVHFPFLRLKHRWFYTLQGRLPEFPRNVVAYADVLTEHPGEGPENSRIYRGVVLDFEIADDGSLESLTLGNARRGKGRGETFQWSDIPSSRFIIVGKKIHSINITYFTVEEEEEGNRAFLNLSRRTRTLLRRFFLEEP